MTSPILLASSLLAVVLLLVLAREVRLRRALQTLLRRLITLWRSNTHDQSTSRGGHSHRNRTDRRL